LSIREVKFNEKGCVVIDTFIAGEYVFKYVEFKKSEAIKKYIEEGLGLGAVKSVEKVAEAANDWLTDISTLSSLLSQVMKNFMAFSHE